MRLKWKLDLVRLEILLILSQGTCIVCVERTIGFDVVLDAPDGIVGDVVVWNLVLVHLEIVLVSVQDRCMVCDKHTIGSEIIMDATDGTPR
jgi:hypothetical protein